MSRREKAPVQDQGREEKMIRMLGLRGVVGRLGHDAEDDDGHTFELKSTTKNSFGTGRDVSINMIGRWRTRHWIFAVGTNYRDGFEIDAMYLCTPTMMKEQFDLFEARFGPDLTLRDTVIGYIKKLLEKSQIERLTYLIDRGMTYNNPHISLKYVREHGIELDLANAAQSLKQVMNQHAN